MSIRMLVLGAVVLGAAGQWACTAQADAAQFTTAESEAERGPPSPSEEEGQACGGFGGFQCPEGQFCVDNPNDACDPTQGGADCIGICTTTNTEGKKPKCEHGPGVSYVSRDPEQCLAILFVCPEGSTQFFNDCGCGCRPQEETTCDYTDHRRRYVATSPEQCATIRFVCEPGTEYFSDSCGCGCQMVP